MINTILFDLDGTLLPMDDDKFMELYFLHLGNHFHDLIDPKTLYKNVMTSTEQMIKVNNGKTNEDIFMEHFATLVEQDISIYKERFDSFYKSKFDLVQASTKVSETVHKCVDLLREKGYQIAIATNPIFPYEANIKRVKWAGFDLNDFIYISYLEKNKFCKPLPNYYQEVLDEINKTPEECIMIGNDVLDDTSASKIGIKTYLVNDYLINRYNQEVKADYEGSYEDLYEFIKNMPNIK